MSIHHRRLSWKGILATQLLIAAAGAIGYAGLSDDSAAHLRQSITGREPTPTLPIPRREPLRVLPLYDVPEVISDEELAAVLRAVQPRFSPHQIKPNHVEHALRIWGVDATFDDPEAMPGVEMRDFLIDHGRFRASWGGEVDPLLIERSTGIAIRWEAGEGASVHHDHWLASLTEAGIALDETVITPSRRGLTINDVLQEALRDFDLDEREVEWSAMAFGLWLPPRNQWVTSQGRRMSFDQLVDRLVRGHKRFGVCRGTHRVYSLMLLIRLDDEFSILTPETRDKAYRHLERVRDLITVAQFDDGHWPGNWYEGADAVANPQDEPTYRKVIATGHHLEWLAIAPPELHPPREQVIKAARWLIDQTVASSPETIRRNYTFFSHVGNALAMWRGTRPADFWREWEAKQTSEEQMSDEDLELGTVGVETK